MDDVNARSGQPLPLPQPPVAEDRVRAWCTLSELFLDTDVTLADDSVVRELAALPFSIAELESILEREVAPVCAWNVVWWEWAGFRRDDLAAAIEAYLARPSLLRHLPFPGRHGFGPRGHWASLKRRIAEARAGMSTTASG